MAHNKDAYVARAPDDLDLVFSSGGSRAILGGAGAILALHLAGLRKWTTIGGVSGGTVPALLLAAGYSPSALIKLAIATDFESLLEPRTGLFRRILALLRKYHYESSLPEFGVYGTQPFNDLINSFAYDWPDNFWTIASTRDGYVLFTAAGATHFGDDGSTRVLATKPVRPGLAVVASCAVPGVLDAVRLGDTLLFDGALTAFGECPVEAAKLHFRAEPAKVIAFDPGPEHVKKSRILRFLWHLMCGGRCRSIDAVHHDDSDGSHVIMPEMDDFHGLQFNLTADQKWRAIIAAYTATIDKLVADRVVEHARLEPALRLRSTLSDLRRTSSGPGTLAGRCSHLLSTRSLVADDQCADEEEGGTL